jgi:hypothetical protein
MNIYTDVCKKVGPNKEMVRQLNEKLSVANISLKKKVDDFNLGYFKLIFIKANVSKLKNNQMNVFERT